MTESQTPFPRPDGEPPLPVFDIVLYADHTRFSDHLRAGLMSIAKDAVDRHLAIPGVDEQATRLVIARRGASQLPDWEIVGPELLAACQAAVAEAPTLHCAPQLRTAITNAGGRA